jgi:hypothetical protein
MFQKPDFEPWFIKVCSRIGFKQVAKIINMWILKVFYKVHILAYSQIWLNLAKSFFLWVIDSQFGYITKLKKPKTLLRILAD